MEIFKRLALFITDTISWCIGKLAEIKPPQIINRWVINRFINRYKVDLSEINDSISSFKSFQEFFIRDLKKESRSIEADFVSPVDGTLREFGDIDEKLCIENVKGKPYKIFDLIKDESLSKKFSKGRFFNFYLAPKDYHHVHAPCNGRIVSIKHIPGMLLPVNDWFFKRVPFLFAINERVVFEIQSNLSSVLVVMVGALNVGKIKVDATKLPCSIQAGERIGTFMLGSSVVVLCEKKMVCELLPESKVKFGQKLGR